MYKRIFKPLFFTSDPERIHRVVSWFLGASMRLKGIRMLARNHFVVKDDRLQRSLWGLSFPNPVGMAAGFDKEGKLYNELADLGFGFVEIGTFTPQAQPGNSRPRLFRLPRDKALINRMGFNNDGVAEAVERIKRIKPRCIIGGNIGKNTDTPRENAPEDYEIAFQKLFPYVDYFVINVSCPNISNMKELQDKEELRTIVNKVTEVNNSKVKPKPVLLKISPDLNNSQIDDTLDIIDEAGIHGVIATNTTLSRSGLTTAPEAVENIGEGGLSGEPLHKRSTEIIKYISKKTRKELPIIGVGGIMTPKDALEKLRAGASLVQVYTGFIYEGPSLARRINKAILKNYSS
ncbi:MAG: quinone-dependent dihydroorotate dehydrogenase [Bacteroidales bacterium]|nr:quinone-dependent dihydroorotate dehydrogenase [Bacteroidales bacterium]MCF8334608.1 quinone-dependent dihydroorotate dehydrogenase [Bacteroidales bacterium]